MFRRRTLSPMAIISIALAARASTPSKDKGSLMPLAPTRHDPPAWRCGYMSRCNPCKQRPPKRGNRR